VAANAIIRPLAKLIRVRILVTIAAAFGRFCEVDMAHRHLEIRRLVTVRAINGAMRSDQREVRAFVMEFREVLPDLRRMACLATQFGAFGSVGRHAFCKFSFMYVVMTRCAGQLAEMEGDHICSGRGLVTFIARNGNMAACELKA
jgi:hypothetical protein